MIAYDDTAGFLSIPITIKRSTGDVTLSGNLNIGTAATMGAGAGYKYVVRDAATGLLYVSALAPAT